MSLRARITLLVALSVASAVAVVSLVAWLAARNQLVGQIDEGLAARLSDQPRGDGAREREPGHGPPVGPFLQEDEIVQVVDSEGTVLRANSGTLLPVRALTSGSQSYTTVEVDEEPYRMLSQSIAGGLTVQIATPLGETEAFLRGLGLALVSVALVGIGLACGIGFLVTWRAITPVGDLTAAAEQVAETQDLSSELEVHRRDEIGRLAHAFNSMLRALDESRLRQRRLVEDASHELRTPLTALRTNIDVLVRRDGSLSGRDLSELLADVNNELEELTVLVTDLVQLALDPATAEQQKEDVRLDLVAERAADRARRRTGREIVVDSEPTTVHGAAASLERAVANLIDNACKFSSDGTVVRVGVRAGTVTVDDEGDGIPEEDLPHVFERFHRAKAARAVPGSGLGLSIVEQVAASHGGSVFALNRPSAGASLGFRLPEVDPEVSGSEPSGRPVASG